MPPTSTSVKAEPQACVLSLFLHLRPHFVAPGVLCNFQVLWAMNLYFSMVTDGYCQSASFNPSKNNEGWSNDSTGYWLAETGTKRLSLPHSGSERQTIFITLLWIDTLFTLFGLWHHTLDCHPPLILFSLLGSGPISCTGAIAVPFGPSTLR